MWQKINLTSYYVNILTKKGNKNSYLEYKKLLTIFYMSKNLTDFVAILEN